MEFSAAGADFLTRHQLLEFLCSPQDGKRDEPKLADNLRNMYLHQGYLTPPGIDESRDREVTFEKSEEYLRAYAEVVDRMDTGALNNYASEALALCEYQKNDSGNWYTSMTEDKLAELTCFQAVLAENGATSETDDFDIPLTLRLMPPYPPATITSSSRSSTSSPRSTYSTDSVSESGNRSPRLSINNNSLLNNNFLPTAAASKPTGPSAFQQSPWQQRQQQTKQSFVSLDQSQQPGQLRLPSPRSASSATTVTPPQNQAQLKRSLYQEVPAVQPSRVGGPYSNFGQKQKNSTNSFNQSSRARRPWGGKRSSHEEGEEDSSEDDTGKRQPFKTARDQLLINQQKKGGGPVSGANYGAGKKSLGTRRGPASKFVPPVLNRDSDQADNPASTYSDKSPRDEEEPVDERLKGIDPKMIELINNEIMDTSSSLTWSDIAGLEFAKKTIQEIVVWPMLRPDIFTGLRGPPKGLLLFGPPGTGKTLIGKCIASQSKSTFFCISASSLTSKWVGEGEKMVRTLFAVARCHQPAVIFIDEIDSLLSQRSDSEHESSRRIKTEFLVQLDGATTESEDRILVIGATNRPQEIDEAARRRFVKRLLIPLPEAIARRQIVLNLMSQQNSDLDEESVQRICDKTDGYSGADMTNLCREAALGPIRSIPFERMETITPDQVRPIQLSDFEQALLQVRASVSDKDLELYTQWNKTYGSFGQ